MFQSIFTSSNNCKKQIKLDYDVRAIDRPSRCAENTFNANGHQPVAIQFGTERSEPDNRDPIFLHKIKKNSRDKNLSKLKAIEKAIKTPQKTQFNIITKTKIIIRKSKVQIKTIIKNYNVKYFIFKCTPTPNIKNVQKKHIFNKHLVFKLIKPKKYFKKKYSQIQKKW